MNRTRRLAVLLIGFIALHAGCSDEPREAYERVVFHAKMGNEEAFIQGFTEDSQRLIRTLLALRRTYGDLVSTNADPYLSIVFEEVEDVETSEEEFHDGVDKVTRDVAILTVTNGQVRNQIKMIEFEDGWKIDALYLQKHWQEHPETFMSQ